MLEIMLSALVLLFIIAGPLALIYRRVKSGKKSKNPLIGQLVMFFGFVAVGSVYFFAQSASAAAAGEAASLVQSDGFVKGMGYLSAALAVGLSGVGGGIAVSASAAAALGAISENEGTFGKALIFVGMAEGVALYGLLIAFMIISGL